MGYFCFLQKGIWLAEIQVEDINSISCEDFAKHYHSSDEMWLGAGSVSPYLIT